MLLFEIHMIPRPQRQTQLGKGMWFDPSKNVKYQIRWQIGPHAPKEPLQGPLHVFITFYLPIPKKARGNLRQQMINAVALPIRRPDIDNLAYLVTNAMKELVYEDDAQIVDLTLSKRYGEDPRTVIKVVPI